VVVTGDPELDDQYKVVANMSVDLEDGVNFHFYVNRKYRKMGHNTTLIYASSIPFT